MIVFGVVVQQGQIIVCLFQFMLYLCIVKGIQWFVGEVDGCFYVDVKQYQLFDYGVDVL